MIRFECDYSEGCIEKIQNALIKTNLEQTPGYGMDPHCERARNIIRKLSIAFCNNLKITAFIIEHRGIEIPSFHIPIQCFCHRYHKTVVFTLPFSYCYIFFGPII